MMVAQVKVRTGNPKFVHVAQWANDQLQRGHPAITIEFALSMLPFARQFIVLCGIDPTTIPSAPCTRLEAWQQMWRSSRELWLTAATNADEELGKDITESFQFLDEGGLSTILSQESIRKAAKELSSMSLSRRKAVGRLMRIKNGKASKELLEHIDQIVGEDSSKDLPLPPVELLDSFLFLSKIYIPCFAHFGLAPDVIYRQAIEGDRQSLDRLLALDRSAESMPEIRDILLNEMSKGKSSPLGSHRLEQVRSVGVNQKSCKALVICWCREWSRLIQSMHGEATRRVMKSGFGVTLQPPKTFTIPHLRNLFDAYAKDCGLQVDEDLQADGDALRKMVSRLEKHFPLRAWDIFSSINVPMI